MGIGPQQVAEYGVIASVVAACLTMIGWQTWYQGRAHKQFLDATREWMAQLSATQVVHDQVQQKQLDVAREMGSDLRKIRVVSERDATQGQLERQAVLRVWHRHCSVLRAISREAAPQAYTEVDRHCQEMEATIVSALGAQPPENGGR